MTKYASYILYLLISIFVVILYVNGFGPMENLQRSVNDFLCKVSASESVRPNIVLVTIDGPAEDAFGQWPWNYDMIADLIAATANGNPKAITLNFILSEDATQDSAGYTDILAGQLSWIDNVIMPYDIALANYRSKKMNNPKYLFNNSLTVDNPLSVLGEESTLLVRKVFLPADKLLEQHPFLGFKYDYPDNDRILRRQPLIMNFEGYYYPSLSLISAAVYLNVPPDRIKVVEHESILLGNERIIPINDRSEFYIKFPDGNTYTSYSAATVLGEGFDFSLLKDKLVIIGLKDFNYDEIFDTPVQRDVPGLQVKASIIENIINNNMLVEKKDLALLNMLILFAIGGLCAFLLPRMNLMYRMIILFVGLIILANVNYFMFSSFKMIINTVYFGLELILFMIASPFLDSQILTGEMKAKPVKKTPPKTRTAEEKPVAEIPVRELKLSVEDPENQDTVVLDKEETQEPARFDDYQTISLDDSSDGSDRTQISTPEPEPSRTEAAFEGNISAGSPTSLREPENAPIESGSGKEYVPDDDIHITDSDKIRTQADSIKNLGRYQITGTLGKGAMGLVYKGVDPAINRPVALKTIRLDFVNDPEELAELKERLHREAQAAGKLSHPNIVTIYDVGSEGHLQYIAMECLEGQTLENMIKKKVKFNYRIIAQIIIQICTALDYAHSQGIVHRDIKPANIMVLNDYRIKVMDFGIARIDSNSMTKTGIAMGTPNYISPEQLKGLKTDSRADIFSLGVVMYEMLLGRRPFKGENITSLIYAIINKEPEKPSNVNPQIPLLFDHIIDKALKKNPQERYQKATELIADLKDFVESFSAR
ncbi:MAG: CHASE2 domain-containing protein [candidate division Zixibacteria bacterium]|nr:CHASE2 domain-containing protein [candidate division Zixibacteria bacterium]